MGADLLERNHPGDGPTFATNTAYQAAALVVRRSGSCTGC